ncbi:MAG: helix-turn-helix transcriptional regulator [Chloroflexota bacterium]
MTSSTPSGPLPQGPGAYNRTVYHDDLLRIGLFFCRPWEDLFHDDTQAQGRYVVFPHSCVYITPEGDERHVADPTVVIFYNKHQTYRRAKLSEQGDACAYFEFAPDVLREVMPHYDPAREDRPDYPFPLNVGRSDAHSYLLHRLVVAHVLQQDTPDSLFVQETMMHVLQRTVENALPPSSKQAPSRATRRAHAHLARDAQSLLAMHFHEPLTLPQIAARLHVSPYHLCRVFRRQTGRTIHQHRKDLRLRAALDHVLAGETDLGDLALALGFANHSHFTKAFRLLFNTTPSNLRDPQALRQMSKNLTV